ncbi:MAG TPA: peptidoglycan bridge formation glycyltransferase FemA/FemB family protein [Terriglobales bacterium]|nr:peptidoglycan bridge formation glycyltransferase FemA/FemB family protein [Terriglobales bacterium]
MTLQFLAPADLSPELIQEIAGFLDSQDSGHPFQFPQWSAPGNRFAVVRQENRIRWFANCGLQFPLGTRLRGFRAMSVNRGPVCDDRFAWNTGINLLLRQGRADRLVYLDASPDWLQDLTSKSLLTEEWRPSESKRVSLRLDLQQTPDELLAQFRKNTRYEVRRAERAGIIVSPTNSEREVDAFLSLYSSLAGRKGFAADSPDHLRAIVRWLIAEPSRGALMLARDGATVAGGAVIVRSGKRCWYVWGASDKREHFSAGHAVQWQALLWAQSRGCTEYDFGGYTPGATSGPAWFKEGFGGRVVEFVPAHRFVFRRRPYRLFRMLTRAR